MRIKNNIFTECPWRGPLDGSIVAGGLSQLCPLSPGDQGGSKKSPPTRTQVRGRFLTLIHHNVTTGWCRMWVGSSWFHLSDSRQTILAFSLHSASLAQHAEGPQWNTRAEMFPWLGRASTESAALPAGFTGVLQWENTKIFGAGNCCPLFWKVQNV